MRMTYLRWRLIWIAEVITGADEKVALAVKLKVLPVNLQLADAEARVRPAPGAEGPVGVVKCRLARRPKLR